MDAEAFALLTSRKGWAGVAWDQKIWIPCPAVMPEDYDEARWARDFAWVAWTRAGLPHGDRELSRLEAQLAHIYEGTYGTISCHQVYLHLPDPRQDPLPVFLAILAAGGDKDTRLREITEANDPTVVQPPVIEEFTTDKLGTGIKVLRHFRVEADAAGEDAEIAAGLDYGFRVEKYETDLRLSTATADLSRLQQAIPDIDSLARAITITPSNLNPAQVVADHRKVRR